MLMTTCSLILELATGELSLQPWLLVLTQLSGSSFQRTTHTGCFFVLLVVCYRPVWVGLPLIGPELNGLRDESAWHRRRGDFGKQSFLRILLLGGYALTYSTAYSFPFQQLFVREGIRCFPGSQVDKTTKRLVNIYFAQFRVAICFLLKKISSQFRVAICFLLNFLFSHSSWRA